MKQKGSYIHSPAGKDTLSRRIAFLKKVLLFADVSDEELAVLANDFRLKEYKKGEIIFHQGDRSRRFYIIMKGKVRIFKVSPSGGETSINIFSIHNVIGEFATIDSRPRSATAKAISPCVLLQMTQNKFLRRMREMPDLGLGMARLLASKVRWTANYAETVAQYDAAGRLLHILLLYNEKFGQVQEPGKRYLLDLSLNQTDLASLIGSRREWVNRLLRDWRQRGLIEYKAGKIIILDLPKVEQERDGRIEANLAGW